MIEEQALGIAHAPLWYLRRTELAAIYKMDESVKAVKVTLQKGADGDYLLLCEVVDGGDGAAADSVVFNNETIPEVPDNPDKPGNPDKPDTPEVPDSPDAPRPPRRLRALKLLAMRTCFPKRGTALRRLRCSRSLSAVWGWRQSPDACAGSDGSVLSHEKSMQRARA